MPFIRCFTTQFCFRTLFFIGLILFLVFTTHAMADLLEDFNDNSINQAVWMNRGDGIFSESSSALTFTGASAPDSQNGGLVSKFLLSGDFEITVDCQNWFVERTVPNYVSPLDAGTFDQWFPSATRVGIEIRDNSNQNNFTGISREYPPYMPGGGMTDTISAYSRLDGSGTGFVSANSPTDYIPTNTEKLRIERVGGLINAYFYDELQSQWRISNYGTHDSDNMWNLVEQAYTGPVEVRLTGQIGDNVDSFSAQLDNVQIQAREIFYPANNPKVAVLLVEPSSGVPHSTESSDYQGLTDKITDYYSANSQGKFNMDFTILDNGGEWYKLDKSEQDYKGKEKELVQDAIQKAGIGPSSGYDMVLVVHSGNSIVTGGVLGSAAFASTSGALVAEKDSMTLDMQDNLSAYSHELGHLIGDKLYGKPLPDWRNFGNMINGANWQYDAMTEGWGGREPPNLNSITRELLGWADYRKIEGYDGGGLVEIKALDAMGSGDRIPKVQINDDRFYVLEYRTKDGPAPYDHNLPAEGLIIYGVDTHGSPEPYYVTSGGDKIKAQPQWDINILNLGKPDGNNSYVNPIDRVKVTTKWQWGDVLTVDLQTNAPIEQKGFGFTLKDLELFSGKLGDWALSDSFEGPFPDLDLHVFTDDGRHIGVNYNTGVYEYGIAGALASGDMLGSYEWIILPPDLTDYHFLVSSADIENFLKNNPQFSYLENELSEYEVRGYLLDPSTNALYQSAMLRDCLLPGKQNEWLINYSEGAEGGFAVDIASTSVVPEPATLSLFGLGLLGLALRKKFDYLKK